MTAGGSIQELGPFIVASGFEDALALWDALRAFYLQRRPMRPTLSGFYPETTIGDVQQVAGLLTAAAAKLPMDALGRVTAVARWNAYRAELQRLTGGRFMFDVYPDNRRFWMAESRALALDAATANELPTKSDVVLSAVRGSATLAPQGTMSALYDDVAGVVDDALDVGKSVAGGVVDAARDLAGEAKDLVEEVGGGAKDLLKGTVTGVTDAVVNPVVDAVGKPLLIGAAVVGGLFLVPRLVDGKKRRAA